MCIYYINILKINILIQKLKYSLYTNSYFLFNQKVITEERIEL